jgi:hypothetical protein
MTTPKKEVATAKSIIHPTLGFGVPATSDPHHFIVEIPRSNTGAVSIVENLGLQSHDHTQSQIIRCVLERPRWTEIRSEVQRAFNIRLKERQLKTSAWKVGTNPVDRLLGKELCVLAWAIEGMEFDHIPIAVRNWLALRPEERWWLFGMTAITTGGVNDGGKGWRLALRHALGDVAQNELFKPRVTQTVSRNTANDDENGTLNLFDFEP